ncbi:MAG: hypothetical protein IJO63_00060 [Bacilli bacterium]|nr:hypothetical protein [Bacilli bacterium]
MFFKKTLFDKCFKLDDNLLLFKNTICFNYKNIYDDNYVVQGFTISRDYSLVSAYNKFHAKSRVYLYEKNGKFNKYIELDNSNHVGGISYDYINDLVYITGSKGNVDVYSYPELICGNIVKIKSDINISEIVGEVLSAATLYFYDNKLYVCTFEGIGKMVIFDLEFSKNKVSVISSKIINDLPPAVQGICVFKNSDKLYYLFSQSYSKLNSIIKLFDGKFNFLGQYKLKDIGLEGIDIDYTGNVCGVFENGVNILKKVHIMDIICRKKKRLEKHFFDKGNKFSEKLKENIEKY